MRKIILLLVILIGFSSCSKDDKKQSYLFRNGTNYIVKVINEPGFSSESPNFEFTLNPGETKNYESDFRYSLFQVSSNQTTRNFSYEFQGETRVIYDFGKMVEYKITGTATSAILTYATSNGGTYQRTVSLPHTVGFNYFANNFKYISAQNNTNSGSVRVELFIEDSFITGQTCTSAHCIATAHN